MSKTRPEPYTNTAEAMLVAKPAGGRLVAVDHSVCGNLKVGESGFLVAANAKDLYDVNGECWNVRVRCHRVAKGTPGEEGYEPGKYELFLEKVSEDVR